MSWDALTEGSEQAQSPESSRQKSGWQDSVRQQSSDRGMLGLFIFAVVTAIAMIYEFGGALNSYFTSDDLVLVNYVYRVFNGDPGLLLRMFTTVWMPDSTQEIFYRPLVEASYALDFLISGTNPLGYHISNFLYSFFAAFAVFSIGKSLARRFEFPHPDAIGYVSAFLFAVNPLHAEVTTWIVGRVDGLSTMFYLAAFALFLKLPPSTKISKHYIGWLSLSAFALALLSKEMAITLPPTIFLCCLFLSEEKKAEEKVRTSLMLSLPYFAVLALYLPVRYMAIGTLIGGYVGALGDAMQHSILDSIMRLNHLWKAAFPFNEEFIDGNGAIATAFHVFYALAGVYLVVRLFFDWYHKKQLKLFAFLLSWLVLQYLPLLQVFKLSQSLAGGRLFYLSTAILSIIVAIALVPGGKTRLAERRKRLLKAFACVLLCFLSSLFVIVGKENNNAWIIAALHVKELQKEIKSAVSELPEQRKLLIAYLPMQVLGAFVFNRYYLLQALLSPPLLPDDISNRVSVLEPRFYMSNTAIPPGVLRRKLADKEKNRTVFWNVDRFKLTDLSPAADECDENRTAKQSLPELCLDTATVPDNTIISAKRPFKSSAVRFVEVDLVNTKPSLKTGKMRKMYLRFEDLPEPPRWMDFWCAAPYDPGLKFQTLRFPVDEVFSWYLLKQRSKFSMYHGTGHNFSLSAARLVDGRDLTPQLSVAGKNLRECNDGVYRPIAFPLEFKYDVSNVSAASSCICELSRPRSMFQLENYTYRGTSLSKKPLKTWTLTRTTGSISIDKEVFPENACYQLRVFARKADGHIAGTSSDLIYLGISDLRQGQDF
ncbi:MAG: hypothetical protein IT342_05125 [Candidatus Melainabacteria bacterium]|nr:hypothetical protein [Candidatus Melainabacteria bacterium]